MNGIGYASAVDLGATRAYAEFGSVESLLVNKLPSGSINPIVADGKLGVVLPDTREDNSDSRVAVPGPESQDCPAKWSSSYKPPSQLPKAENTKRERPRVD